MQCLATILESFGALHRLEEFACTNGKRFYGVTEKPGGTTILKLRREDWVVPESYLFGSSQGSDADESGEVIPFWAGKKLTWKLFN
jgi:dihydroorotase